MASQISTDSPNTCSHRHIPPLLVNIVSVDFALDDSLTPLQLERPWLLLNFLMETQGSIPASGPTETEQWMYGCACPQPRPESGDSRLEFIYRGRRLFRNVMQSYSAGS